MKNFWNRALWPLLGLGLLAVVGLQARAAVTTGAGKPAAAAPPGPAAGGSGVAAEGRVVSYPGAEVVVGTDLAGTVVVLNVQEKEKVRRGQVLAELRSDDHRAALEEARARVLEADADIRLAESEVERARALWDKAVGSRQAVDRAERDVDAARARRATAKATADRLAAVLAKTRIVSPIDGVVIARHADSGETLEAGQRLLTIADLSKTRVEAELDEFDAGRVSLATIGPHHRRGLRGTVLEGRGRGDPRRRRRAPAEAPGPGQARGHACPSGQDRVSGNDAPEAGAAGGDPYRESVRG